jgi:hypothetical protein
MADTSSSESRQNALAYWVLAALCAVVLLMPFFFLDRFGIHADLSWLRLLKFMAAAALGIGVGVAITAGAAAVAPALMSQMPVALATASVAAAVGVGAMVFTATRVPKSPIPKRVTSIAELVPIDTAQANRAQLAQDRVADSLAEEAARIGNEGVTSDIDSLIVEKLATQSSPENPPSGEPAKPRLPKKKPLVKKSAEEIAADANTTQTSEVPEARTPEPPKPAPEPPLEQLRRLDLRKYGYQAALVAHIKDVIIDIVEHAGFDYTLKPRSTDLVYGNQNPFLLMLSKEERVIRLSDMDQFLKRDKSVVSAKARTMGVWRVLRVVREGTYLSTSGFQNAARGKQQTTGTSKQQRLSGFSIEYIFYLQSGATGESLFKLYSPYVYASKEDALSVQEWSLTK